MVDHITRFNNYTIGESIREDPVLLNKEVHVQDKGDQKEDFILRQLLVKDIQKEAEIKSIEI